MICHACMSCTCEPRYAWIVCELRVQSVSSVCADGAQSRRGAHAELCVRRVIVSVCSWPGPTGTVTRLPTCTPHLHVDSVIALNMPGRTRVDAPDLNLGRQDLVP